MSSGLHVLALTATDSLSTRERLFGFEHAFDHPVTVAVTVGTAVVLAATDGPAEAVVTASASEAAAMPPARTLCFIPKSPEVRLQRDWRRRCFMLLSGRPARASASRPCPAASAVPEA